MESTNKYISIVVHISILPPIIKIALVLIVIGLGLAYIYVIRD